MTWIKATLKAVGEGGGILAAASVGSVTEGDGLLFHEP